MSDEVLLKFRYEERDFVNIARLRIAVTFRHRWDLVLGLALCVLGLFLTYEFAPTWVWQTAAVALGLAAALVVTMLAVVLFVVPPIAFQRQREDLEVSLELSEEGIAITRGKKHGAMKWASCRRIEQDARAYLLMYGERGALIIPRRIFRSERQEEAFRRLLAEFMPKGDEGATG